MLPVLEGRTLTAIEVTLAGMSSLLLWYSSPEQTLLLPPSTAHRPESAPANDTAPRGHNVNINSILQVQTTFIIIYVIKQYKVLPTKPWMRTL